MNGIVDSWKRKKIERKPEQKRSEDKKRRLKSVFIDWKMQDIVIFFIIVTITMIAIFSFSLAIIVLTEMWVVRTKILLHRNCKRLLKRDGSPSKCSGCWKCFHSQVSSRDAQERILTCQNSPFALHSSMVLRERVFLAWKISQPKPQRCLKVGLEWIVSQAHQETVKGLSSRQKLAFCIFWRRRRWVVLILNLDFFFRMSF